MLALLVSVLTTLSLTFFDNVYPLLIIIVLTTSFFATFLSSMITLEFLFYSEIKITRELVDRLGHSKTMAYSKVEAKGLMRELDEKIIELAVLKEKEIDKLKKLETFRREFVANVSHELKTPLFAAQGFVETLLEGAMDDERVRAEFLRKAAKSLDSLENLVSDLLILSQIETGSIQMNKEYFDLVKLLFDVNEQFEDKAISKNIDLSLLVSPDVEDYTVYADWQRIRQVMNNLVSNAINYTQEGGEVDVEVKDEDKYLLVEVRDNGPGIPPKDQKRIFERFYRVDKSRSRVMGGTGLGLAIVKHIIDNHQSEIRIESSPKKGTTFSFHLPKED